MPTEIHHPSTPLAPAVLDRYLTIGWRPSGQAVYTADYLRADDHLVHGVIQVRLPLAGFAFKKRHRKRMRANGRRFTHTIERATTPDATLNALNARYARVHPAKSLATVDRYVLGDLQRRVLDTHIIRIYDGERLVAFSYFDRGATTAYSKAGIYDPDYGSFSLGIYTMLLEIEYARDSGLSYYHPGYISPTYPVFDYKLSFGPMEFRRVSSGEWLPFTDATRAEEDPYAISRAALEQLAGQAPAGWDLTLFEYRSFTARFHYPDGPTRHLLGEGLFLVPRAQRDAPRAIIVYRPDRSAYTIYAVSVAPLRDTTVTPGRDPERPPAYQAVLNVENILFEHTDWMAVRDRLRHHEFNHLQAEIERYLSLWFPNSAERSQR